MQQKEVSTQYIRYSDESADQVDEGYPKEGSAEWGVEGTTLSAGFDSMTQAQGKTYVKRVPWYVRYTDKTFTEVDSGYPLKLASDWGELPEHFKSDFDAMAILPNGKLYVTKGYDYIRYSDTSASELDSGYPRPITGNWGNVSQ